MFTRASDLECKSSVLVATKPSILGLSLCCLPSSGRPSTLGLTDAVCRWWQPPCRANGAMPAMHIDPMLRLCPRTRWLHGVLQKHKRYKTCCQACGTYTCLKERKVDLQILTGHICQGRPCCSDRLHTIPENSQHALQTGDNDRAQLGALNAFCGGLTVETPKTKANVLSKQSANKAGGYWTSCVAAGPAQIPGIL